MDIEKIHIMTKLAIFEKKEGRDIMEVSRFFKGDYVAARIFKAILHYSLCFLLVTMLAGLIQLETILLNLNFRFLGDAVKFVSLLYLLGLLLTILVSGFGAGAQYDRAHTLGERYIEKLESLLSYEQAGRAVRYAREEASSYMREHLRDGERGRLQSAPEGEERSAEDWPDSEDEAEEDWLDEPEIDVLNIMQRGNRHAVH